MRLFSAHYGDVAGSMVPSRSAEIKEGKSTPRPQRERYKYTALNSDLLGDKKQAKRKTSINFASAPTSIVYQKPKSIAARYGVFDCPALDAAQRLERELFDAAVK